MKRMNKPHIKKNKNGLWVCRSRYGIMMARDMIVAYYIWNEMFGENSC